MIGLRTLNIVLLSKGFPVEQVTVEDFNFHGSAPVAKLKLPQLIQATVNEYAIQLLPDRFEVVATTSKATQHRMEAIVGAARFFLEEFTSPRAITAIGHNFTGSFPAKGGDAAAYMAAVSWPSWFAACFEIDGTPTQSVTTKFDSDADSSTTVKLEPSSEDGSRIHYDINVNWGDPQGSSRLPVWELIERLPASAEILTSLVERVSAFTPATQGEGK